MDRRQVILDATMKVVVEVGLRATTIALISKKSKMSAGVIYHYFCSKEEIIHTVFKQLEEQFHTMLLRDNPLEKPIMECYKVLWIGTYRFAVANPTKAEYMDRYRHSAYALDRCSVGREQFLEKLKAKNLSSVEGGELLDVPIETIYAMTNHVALEIARIKISGKDPFKSMTIDSLAEAVVKSILITKLS